MNENSQRMTDNIQAKQTSHQTIIIGMGKTGLSCARFMAGRGQSFAIADSRNSPPDLENFVRQYPEVEVYTGEFDPELLAAAALLVISPGVPVADPAIQHARSQGTQLTGDIELFARHANAPVVAITGSNGKSTVASLISTMIAACGLDVYLGGNFGTPALDFLDKPAPDFYVLELSSFQLETVNSLDAVVSVVLNISADHMDRYTGLDEYAGAKQHIYAGTGTMVINKDDGRVLAMKLADRNTIGFSLSEPETGDFGLRLNAGQEWLSQGMSLLMPVASMMLKGRHNIANALATLAMGHAIGLPTGKMIDVLKSYSGLPHRCEWVADFNGVTWINDSKGTNPGASCAAIEGLARDNDMVLIAGGDGKGADFTELADSVRGRVHATVLIGRDANRIATALAGMTQVYFATGMDAAVRTAAEVARPGDKVLLSPACASLDMFRDYQDRGHCFIEAVISLQGRVL
jgi:UDP-N-acetylmuramoylalanine--D-glutamate ligase